MMDQREFLDRKQKIKDKVSDLNRAQGRLDQLKADLQSKYGCATVEEAEAKKAEMEKDQETLFVKITDLENSLKTSMSELGL